MGRAGGLRGVCLLAYGCARPVVLAFGAGTASTLSFEPGRQWPHNLVRFLLFHSRDIAPGSDLPRATLNAGLILRRRAPSGFARAAPSQPPWRLWVPGRDRAPTHWRRDQLLRNQEGRSSPIVSSQIRCFTLTMVTRDLSVVSTELSVISRHPCVEVEPDAMTSSASSRSHSRNRAVAVPYARPALTTACRRIQRRIRGAAAEAERWRQPDVPLTLTSLVAERSWMTCWRTRVRSAPRLTRTWRRHPRPRARARANMCRCRCSCGELQRLPEDSSGPSSHVA